MDTKADQDVRRVLDHGIVVAGEVQVQLLGLKLLPVKVKLFIGSTTLAEALGMSWWTPRRRGESARSERPAPRHPARNGAGRRGISGSRARKREV